MKWISFDIQKNDEGKRVDSICKKILDLPFSVLMKEVRKKNIRLNSSKTDIKQKVKRGDILNIAIFLEQHLLVHSNEEQKRTNQNTQVNIVVLHQKKGVVILEKPAGKKIFADPKENDANTIAKQLEKVFIQHKSISFTPAPCHRLDFGTSGILMCAYTAEAARTMHSLQIQEKIAKVYIGILHHRLSSNTKMNHVLYRDTKANVTYAFESKEVYLQLCKTQEPLQSFKELGPAQLFYRCIGEFLYHETKLFLYAFVLEGSGGKTHQIRCQCATEGSSLVGDIKYSSKNKNEVQFKRFFLHFAMACFLDEKTISDMQLPSVLISQIPQDWKKTFTSQQAKQCFDAWDAMITSFCEKEEVIDIKKVKKFITGLEG